MGSKAEYEARKAAKRAQRAAEAAVQQPAVSEANVIQAAEAAPDADQELHYRATFTASQAAFQAAGLARLTMFIMVGTEHPLGEMLLSRIFPEHQDNHSIGFCITVEPGRIIAQRERGTDDTDDGYETIHIRGAIRLEVGEVVHAALLERVGSHALRCVQRVLYPGITLPDGWREMVAEGEMQWADEDPSRGDFFGPSVGELIVDA